MADIVSILEPVRHLGVWDRVAQYPKGDERGRRYEVMIRWEDSLPKHGNRVCESREVLGFGKTEEEAALHASQLFIEKIESSIAQLEKLVSRMRSARYDGAK